jgi:phosphate transport system protein
MARKHIVRAYDEELDLLRSRVVALGKETEEQLAKALQAFVNRDTRFAEDIVRDDSKVNALQREVEQLAVRMLATRQPMALDLRNIIAGLKIASDLERIGDYAANIARHVNDLDQVSPDKPVQSILQMAQLCREMLRDAVGAYLDSDPQRSIEIWHRDDGIDQLYAAILTDLQGLMKEDPENVRAYTGLIFVARCCERIGDHITNVVEEIFFIEHGEAYRGFHFEEEVVGR